MKNEYTYHAYFEAIRTYAQDVIEIATSEDRNFSEVIFEIVSTSNWGFQFFSARQVIEHSSNDTAYEDDAQVSITDGQRWGSLESYESITCRVAQSAMRQDIAEMIETIKGESNDVE